VALFSVACVQAALESSLISFVITAIASSTWKPTQNKKNKTTPKQEMSGRGVVFHRAKELG
jgi:hypothetical protein